MLRLLRYDPQRKAFHLLRSLMLSWMNGEGESAVNIVVDRQKLHSSGAAACYDAVVVGAGPYGLSVAAHLLGRGLKIAVFGKPLQLWRDNMPKGMLLRSYWWATNLSAPLKKYRLAHYFQS